MPSKKPQIKTVIDTETYEKIKKIAEKENRSMSNLLETLTKKFVQQYETENGEIKVQKNLNMGDNHGTINM